jgi:hypothetical protein
LLSNVRIDNPASSVMERIDRIRKMAQLDQQVEDDEVMVPSASPTLPTEEISVSTPASNETAALQTHHAPPKNDESFLQALKEIKDGDEVPEDVSLWLDSSKLGVKVTALESTKSSQLRGKILQSILSLPSGMDPLTMWEVAFSAAPHKIDPQVALEKLSRSFARNNNNADNVDTLISNLSIGKSHNLAGLLGINDIDILEAFIVAIQGNPTWSYKALDVALKTLNRIPIEDTKKILKITFSNRQIGNYFLRDVAGKFNAFRGHLTLDDVIPLDGSVNDIEELLWSNGPSLFSSEYIKRYTKLALKALVESSLPNRSSTRIEKSILLANDRNIPGAEIKQICKGIPIKLTGGLGGIEELQELLEKNKDYVFMAMFNSHELKISPIISLYLSLKGKTLTDLYHQAWKKNVRSIASLSECVQDEPFREEIITSESKRKLVILCIRNSVHADDFFKFIARLKDLAVVLHNNKSTNTDDLVEIVDHDGNNKKPAEMPFEICSSLLLNRSLDLSAAWLDQYIGTYMYLMNQKDLQGQIDILKSVDSTLIDKEKFQSSIQEFNSLASNISSRQITKEDLDRLKYIATTCSKIKNVVTIKEYIHKAEPKQKELFKLDLNVDGCTFKVLSYLDPYAFDVGLDTGCCQRVGGVGEKAAIDSFINPSAGVLLCQFNDMLLAQSYFHYVDGGYILDNVELNQKNCKRMGWRFNSNVCIELTKVFSDFAQKLKELNPELKYVRCGTAYNKIQSEMFEEGSFPNDPRSFSVDRPYSDFEPYSHIDLLKPMDALKSIQVQLPKRAMVERIVRLIKAAEPFNYRPIMMKLAYHQIISAEHTDRIRKMAQQLDEKNESTEPERAPYSIKNLMEDGDSSSHYTAYNLTWHDIVSFPQDKNVPKQVLEFIDEEKLPLDYISLFKDKLNDKIRKLLADKVIESYKQKLSKIDTNITKSDELQCIDFLNKVNANSEDSLALCNLFFAQHISQSRMRGFLAITFNKWVNLLGTTRKNLINSLLNREPSDPGEPWGPTEKNILFLYECLSLEKISQDESFDMLRQHCDIVHNMKFIGQKFSGIIIDDLLTDDIVASLNMSVIRDLLNYCSSSLSNKMRMHLSTISLRAGVLHKLKTGENEWDSYHIEQLMHCAVKDGLDAAQLKSICKNLPIELHNYSYSIDQMKELAELVIKNNDYMFMSIWNNYSRDASGILNQYMIKKNKKLRDLYHEAWKQNPKSLEMISDIGIDKTFKSEIIMDPVLMMAITDWCPDAAIHAADYFKLIERLSQLAKIKHDNKDIDPELVRTLLLNRSIRLTEDWVEDFIEAYCYLDILSFGKEDQLDKTLAVIKSLNVDLIDTDTFKQQLVKVKEIRALIFSKSYKPIRQDIDLLKSVSTGINKIQNIGTIKRFIHQAEPKRKELFNLNLNVDGCSFKVLSYLDPYAFDVGLDTDCCQRIGGAGEIAAIDSFINPSAGVLLCQFNGMLLAQSYFHYVEKDNGYILDNIEFNEANCRKMGWQMQGAQCIELTKIYSDFANQLKVLNPQLQYVRCGIEYNKIKSILFEKGNLPSDPRSFSTDEEYSDFSYDDHIDLLKPTEQLTNMVINLPKRAFVNVNERFNYRPIMIKLAYQQTLDADQALIDSAIRSIKGSEAIRKMFKKKGVDINLIDLITIVFAPLSVSARTDKGIIYLNEDLIKTPEDIEHYLVHEITHFLQQCFSAGPTVGSTDDSYLDNKYEVEGFQNQSEYIEDTEGKDVAHQYIDKVVEHHDVPKGKVEDKKEELLGKAASTKQAGLLKVPEKTLSELQDWAHKAFASKVLYEIEVLKSTHLTKSNSAMHAKEIIQSDEFHLAHAKNLNGIIDYAKRNGAFYLNFNFSPGGKIPFDKNYQQTSYNTVWLRSVPGTDLFDLRILVSESSYYNNVEKNLSREMVEKSLVPRLQKIHYVCEAFIRFEESMDKGLSDVPVMMIESSLVEKRCKEMLKGSVPPSEKEFIISDFPYRKGPGTIGELPHAFTARFLTKHPKETGDNRYSVQDEFSGLWHKGLWHLIIKVSDLKIKQAGLFEKTFDDTLAEIDQICRHELQHTVQTILSATNEQAKAPGYPSESISNSLSLNGKIYPQSLDESTLLHSQKDVEFYTDLSDCIDTFKKQIVKYPFPLRKSILNYCIDNGPDTSDIKIEDSVFEAAERGGYSNVLSRITQDDELAHIKFVFRSFKNFDVAMKNAVMEEFADRADFITDHNGPDSGVTYMHYQRLDNELRKRYLQYGKYEKAVKEFYKEVGGLLKNAAKNPAQQNFVFPREPMKEEEVTKETREQFLKDLEEGRLQAKTKKNIQHKLPEFDRRYRMRMLKELMDGLGEPKKIAFNYSIFKLAGIAERLTELSADPFISAFILSLPPRTMGLAFNAFLKNSSISISSLKELIDANDQKNALIESTKADISSSLPNDLANKDWFIRQIKKYPALKDKLLQSASSINNLVDSSGLMIDSFSAPQLLLEVTDKFSDPSLALFFDKVKEKERDALGMIDSSNLKDWARNRFHHLRNDWLKRIERFCSDNDKSFSSVLQDGKAIYDAMEAGNLRGQELPPTPLMHPLHNLLLSNLPFIQDYLNGSDVKLSHQSVNEVIDASHHYHEELAAKGEGLKYDALNVVWKGAEYIIVELMTENDLKVEGFKMNHCVGGDDYCKKLKSKAARIFSLRRRGALLEPLLTIETDASGLIIRQDYGAYNSQPSEELKKVVDEWHGGIEGEIDLATLSNSDKIRLAKDGKFLSELAKDQNADVRSYVAQNPSASPALLDTLSKDQDLYVRSYVAKNPSASPALLDTLSKDQNLYLRRYVAQNPSASPALLDTLSKDQNADVRRYVAVNPSASPATLKTLSKDHDADVRSLAKDNPAYKQAFNTQGLIKSGGIPSPDSFLFNEISEWLEGELTGRVALNLKDLLKSSSKTNSAIMNKIKTIPNVWNGGLVSISGYDLPKSLDTDFLMEPQADGTVAVQHGEDKAIMSMEDAKVWYRLKIKAYKKILKDFLYTVDKATANSDQISEFLNSHSSQPMPTGTLHLTDKILKHPDGRRLRISAWFDMDFNKQKNAAKIKKINNDYCWIDVVLYSKGIFNQQQLDEELRSVEDSVAHELLHFEQFTNGINLPSNKIQTYDNSAMNNPKITETDINPIEATELKEENQFDKSTNTDWDDYYLDDYEFYPQLLSSVARFKSIISNMPTEEVPHFLRFFIGTTNQYIGNEKPSKFFIKLRDEAPEKYKKAVKEFFKAVDL